MREDALYARVLFLFLGVPGAILAIILTFMACLLALFGHHPVTTYVLLVLPIALQEIVLAVWLIAKGFTSPGHLAMSLLDGTDTRFPISTRSRRAGRVSN